jgi:hypothetical protein
MGKRTRYSADFKAKVAIDAIRGEQTLTLSRLFVELHGGELKIQSTYGEGTIVDIKNSGGE